MKRSEMVELMVDRFDMESALSLKEQMSYVLRGMETMGMLPPKTQVNKHSELTDDNGNIIFDGIISVPSHEWDKECEIPEYAFKCNNCKCEDN